MLTDEQIVRRVIVLCVAVSFVGLIVIIAYLTVCWRKHRGKRMPETHPTDWVPFLLQMLGFMVCYVGIGAAGFFGDFLARSVPHYWGWSVVMLITCTALMAVSCIMGLIVGTYATEWKKRTGRVYVEHNSKGAYRVRKGSVEFTVDSWSWLARLKAFGRYMLVEAKRDRRWERWTYLYNAPADKRHEVDSYLDGLETTLLPNKEAADKELEKMAEQFGIKPRMSKGEAHYRTYGA